MYQFFDSLPTETDKQNGDQNKPSLADAILSLYGLSILLYMTQKHYKPGISLCKLHTACAVVAQHATPPLSQRNGSCEFFPRVERLPLALALRFSKFLSLLSCGKWSLGKAPCIATTCCLSCLPLSSVCTSLLPAFY